MIDWSAKHYAARTHEKMREVLLDPAAEGPAVHYHMIRGGSDRRNVTVWEPGTVGGEYIKTYGHYHVGDLDETYWVLLGEGVAIVQKRVEGPAGPVDDEIERLYAVHVKAGDALYMPSGWGHLVVNVSSTFFATADDSPVDFAETDAVSLPGHADPEDEFRTRPELRRTLEAAPPVFQGQVRVVEIEGFDAQACGGTHVSTTSELGRLSIVRTENKGRINKRLYVSLDL